MSKRLAVLLAALAIFSLPAFAGVGVQAQTSNWSVDTGDIDVTFEPGDGNSLTRDVTVTNHDENNSVTLSATIDNGHDVESSLTLGPGESGTFTATLYPDYPGDATLTIRDENYNSKSITVTVNTPAYVEISGLPDWLDDEGVLQGQTRTAEITVEEVGGYSGFSGINVVNSPSNVNTYDLEQARASAGGSTTVDVSFTAPSGADQHADIGGTFDLDPNDGTYDGGETSSVTLETWVAYPPQFGSISLTDTTFDFDQPKSEGQLTEETDIRIHNSGDRPLELGSVRVSSTAFQDLSVGSVPSTIQGGDSESVPLTVTASTDMDEGLYTISGTVYADTPYVDDGSLDDEMRIRHDVEFAASTNRVQLGDVPIGQASTGSVSVGETLGYKSISDVEMELTDGPDEWMTVTSEPPATIGPGSSSTIGYQIDFNPEADIGSTYRWTYVIDGSGVQSEEVTVSATPIPLNLNPIKEQLQAQTGSDAVSTEMAEGTLDIVESLDEKTRDGSVDQSDISSVLTYSDGVIRFIETSNEAESLLESGEHSKAQSEVIQAAVAYDTMATYSEAIENDELRSATGPVQENAETRLSTLIEDQRSYYQDRLESGETSLLQEAAIKRELALIATLQGDEAQATELDEEADSAFERYSEAVATGEANRQEAAATWETMESEQFSILFGQPVMLNPTNYEDFTAKSDTMMAAYDDAEQAYQRAGETSEAQAVADQRASRAAELQIARYTLFGSIGATILLAIGVVIWTGRGMYWYVQDSREAVTGDFLV